MNNVEKELDKFGKYLVKQSRANLTRKDKNDTSELYNSLDYEIKVSKNSFQFTFLMADYGDYVDKGVKGKSNTKKAPSSPYRFGSGKGKKGGLMDGIDGWVKRKRLQFRKPNGTFLSYSQTTYLIARSIYLTGIKTTNFLTRPFELGFNRLTNELVEAYALDMDKLLITSRKNARQ